MLWDIRLMFRDAGGERLKESFGPCSAADLGAVLQTVLRRARDRNWGVEIARHRPAPVRPIPVPA